MRVRLLAHAHLLAHSHACNTYMRIRICRYCLFLHGHRSSIHQPDVVPLLRGLKTHGLPVVVPYSGTSSGGSGSGSGSGSGNGDGGGDGDGDSPANDNDDTLLPLQASLAAAAPNLTYWNINGLVWHR